MKRELIRTITAKENKKIVCYVNRVDDSYYEVIYNKKSEYLTNNLEAAILVAKVIIVYYQNLGKCNELLYKASTPEEKRWNAILELLRQEYLKSPIDKKLSLKIYETLDSNYQEFRNSKTKEDMERLSITATIRAKDNLTKTIYAVISGIEPSTAYKNYNKYLESRNQYIQKNPYLGLDVLKFTKEEDKNDKGINSEKYARQTAQAL